MAYFAQFALDCPCVAMVTASHNDNGWTGVKMGANRPLTFGPDEMGRLRDIVLAAAFELRDGRRLRLRRRTSRERYIADLTDRPKIKRKLKVVAACGNGTAGAFAPRVLEAIGCEVVPLDAELDYTFPRYNPNPEDMKMLHAIADKVRETGADVGLGFDGDGDRCGVVDNEGEEIFADKIGVMLARDLSKLHPGATFVVDVKSTGLFATDPELKAARRQGRLLEDRPLLHQAPRDASSRRSPASRSPATSSSTAPIGRGYDDGVLTAIDVVEMLDRNPGQVDGRPLPRAAEDLGLADDVAAMRRRGEVRGRRAGRGGASRACRRRARRSRGQPIRDLVTVNGVRVTVEDGTWGLVRASSNKPELVVVVESPVSEARMREMFRRGRRGAAREPGGRRLQSDDLSRQGPRQVRQGVVPCQTTSLTLRTGQGVSSESVIVLVPGDRLAGSRQPKTGAVGHLHVGEDVAAVGGLEAVRNRHRRALGECHRLPGPRAVLQQTVPLRIGFAVLVLVAGVLDHDAETTMSLAWSLL